MPPAVQSPSFASPPDGRPPDRRPKESNPRKGDPAGRVPALRYGQPVVLAHGAGSPVRAITALGPRIGRPRHARQSFPYRPRRSLLLFLVIPAQAGILLFAGRAKQWPEPRLPSGRAEERRARGGQGHCKMPLLRALTHCSCLSVVSEAIAASSAVPPLDRAPQVARSVAQGHVQWGRLFFGVFLLATQKKDTAPPGAHPGQPPVGQQLKVF